MDMTKMVVGIDLGTSNSALAFSSVGKGETDVLSVDQLSSLGKVHRQPTLPSVLYLASKGELGKEDNRLPWTTGQQEDYIVGTFARQRGLQVSDRIVSSAKSWLCHAGVARKDPILPWNSSIKEKVSPFESVVRYLKHLKLAFESHLTKEQQVETLDWSKVDVTLTVPASFDEVARQLSYEASQAAGFKKVTLLEEPQAAFYSWISSSETTWRKQVSSGDLVLVCDIGGGTADFSLICVTEKEKGGLGLERICVGDHLLLGGDNMDHALAHLMKQKLAKQSIKLDNSQFLSLVEQSRDAKEKFFSNQKLKKISLSLVSRGASLMAKAIKVDMTREEIESVLFNGFFPITESTDFPKKHHQIGLQEFGLNYELEPAISKHLAYFLRQCQQNIASCNKLKQIVGHGYDSKKELIMPQAILFNGGVFKSIAFKERVKALLSSWSGQQQITELEGINLDLAVATGAVYFALSKKTGKGIRIRSGTSRSYYLGLETTAIAVPGLEPDVKGLCVVPQGTEEGTTLTKTTQQFGLVTGEPVQFQFYSSSVRAGDQVGVTIEHAKDVLDKSSDLQVTLASTAENKRQVVPVKLDAFVSDVGILELSMQDTQSDKKWQLEFNVRANKD